MIGNILDLSNNTEDFFRYDRFNPENDVMVTVGCPHRKIWVKGFLANDLEFGIDSKWDTLMGGQGSPVPSDILNIADVAGQALFGASIRQPWFSRGVWRGNGPLQIPITMNFVAISDAEQDVWVPLMNLVKLFLPKKESLSGIGGTKSPADVQGIPSVLQQVFGIYRVPGPSVFYPLAADSSDPMSFKIGKLSDLELDVCYFTGLKIKMPPTFTPAGFPLSATASFTVNSQDSLFLDEDGNLKRQAITLEGAKALQGATGAASTNKTAQTGK